MIFRAAFDLKLNLNNSILIGDRLTDIIAGQRAKIPKIYHVLNWSWRRKRRNIEIKKQKILIIQVKFYLLKI